jgi:prepilin-type N-terminal cleavage/methylation domain-containing protein
MTHHTRRHGLTLIEVLIVVGIIAVLLGAVISVVPRIRAAGRKASAQQQMNTLQGVIDAYYIDHRAYPGPLGDDQVYNGTNLPGNVSGRPTMAENAVLGLLGGLRRAGNQLAYDPDRVGKGAYNYSPDAPSAPKVYMDMTAARTMLSAGKYDDGGGRAANDSNIPEFVDGFDPPLPLLYLRARVGAAGIISSGGNYQYDLLQVLPYTATDIGGPKVPHGLRQLGPTTGLTDGLKPGANDAVRYLRQPGTAADNANGTPRQKSRYILIGAGPDRTYGTADDVTSFGNL